MKTFHEDVRFGLRLLRANPAFTAVAVLTLALGIAANTTVFSWIDGLLLRPFPGSADPGRLAVMEGVNPGAPNGGRGISLLDYRDYRENLKLVAGIALHRQDVFSVGAGTNGQPVWGQLVSGNYFDLLGVRPSAGRLFGPEEYGDTPGVYPLVVISDRLWKSRFRRDPSAIGKTLRVNRHELTIVGITQPEFHGTVPGLVFDLWVPVNMASELGVLDASTFKYRGNRNMEALVRLKPDATIAQAASETAALARNLAALYPKTNRDVSATILPAWRMHSGAPDLLLGPLQILMAVAAVVFLIVCANVANLLLARSIARQKEFGIRLAMGAGRGRLARQLLTETLLLAVAGAVVGIPLTFWMTDWLPWLVPNVGVTVMIGHAVNLRFLGFTVLACVLAAMISGAAPAYFSARSGVGEALKQGGRSGTAGVHSNRTQGLLVVSEVALAAVALVGAGLFARSFQNARTIHPGFDRDHVLMARFFIQTGGYTVPEIEQFCFRLRQNLASAPGTPAASYTEFVPLGNNAGPYVDVQLEGYVPAPGENMAINRNLVSPGYFDVMRIPMLDGRDFTDKDNSPVADPVLIVSQAFARRFSADASPVGRKARLWGKWFTIVGVAKDTRYFSASETPHPFVYVPFAQRFMIGSSLYLLVRTTGDPAHSIATLRREVAAIDPNAAASYHAMPLADWTEVTMLPQKVAASLLGGLGLLSLLLSALGLYSVMSYAVNQRTQEIGIRMALGAEPLAVLGGVLRQGMLFTAVGLIAGTGIALFVMRLAGNMLVNVSVSDPLTFATAAAFLGSVAAVATLVPARRATKVDPMVALRCE